MFRVVMAGLLTATWLAAVPQDAPVAPPAGSTPLHDAVWQGDEAAVRLLLDQGTPVDVRHGEGGSTPLLFAALRGNLTMIRLLFAGGADTNAQNNSGATALHLAASRRDAQLTRLLLKAGADPAKPDNAGLKPLDQAAQGGAMDVVNALLDSIPDDGSALALVTDPATAVTLLDRGRYNPTQLSAVLVRAAARDQPELVRLVLRRGADPNTPTAMQTAVSRGYTQVAQELLEARAATGNYIYEAALQGHAAVIRLLAKHGAQLNSIDPATGTTPLYAAASLGHLDAVTALLELGADRTLKSNSGRTPLQAAEASKFEAVADVLRKFSPPQ